MQETLDLSIAGLGIIAYSPFAVAHIPDGADYIESAYWEPADVARHVVDCSLTSFATGSPGDYRLNVYDGPLNLDTVNSATFKLRLGLEVRDQAVCFRDLYDLLDWYADCPDSQRITVPDGFHRLTVYSSPPSSGIIGDNQDVFVHFESVSQRPSLKWEGVPCLCP